MVRRAPYRSAASSIRSSSQPLSIKPSLPISCEIWATRSRQARAAPPRSKATRRSTSTLPALAASKSQGKTQIDEKAKTSFIEAAFADAIVAPRLRIIESILSAAVQDGDVDPDTLTPLTVRVGPALINQHFMTTGAPPSKRELCLVVDTVMGRPASRPE